MSRDAKSWIRFIRRYGPIPQSDSQYDEHVRKSARMAGVDPILFAHPRKTEIFQCFEGERPISVVLTGEAGDGKTHLCREIWAELRGSAEVWGSNESHITMSLPEQDGRAATLHVIRDLSAWVPPQNTAWDPEQEALLQKFSSSLFLEDRQDYFLLAANDGQIVETWRRLSATPGVERARDLFETLLVEDRREKAGVPLRFFNLSRDRSADLLDAALNAFLEHPRWQECFGLFPDTSDPIFGPESPIRRNYDLLKSDLVRRRLRALFELCDYNGLHIPIRQILALLSNAVLGHPETKGSVCKDGLMMPEDVPKVLANGTRGQASIYNNIFGGNLTEARRESFAIFGHLERFRIGFETTNRVDNLLIFGEANENLRPNFRRFVGDDLFYGADDAFRQAQERYIESADEDEARTHDFLGQLVIQRRGLFFKIPVEQEEEFKLWELTVFEYAGEYLSRVIGVLKGGARIERAILNRLIRGLNRIFVGMLVSSDKELFLAKSLAFSTAKVSPILEERVSVQPRVGQRQKVEILLENGMPTLVISLGGLKPPMFRLNLTRYEFLSRVAEGALPNSFSKECYEDVLSFKSQIMTAIEEQRRTEDIEPDPSMLTFQLLSLNDYGDLDEEVVEITIQ